MAATRPTPNSCLGCGTTTIAVNASLALTKITEKGVLLADLDLNSGLVGFMLLGVLWLVLGYVSNYGFPGMSSLGGQGGNLIEGFALLVVGLGLATQWR